MKDVTETFNTVYDATFRELMRCCLLKVPMEDAHDLLQNTYAQFYRNEPDDVSVEDLSLDHAAIDDVLEQLRKEPESTQRMFILYYGYGMKLGDIAKETGTTAVGVKSRLARVRKKLRTSLGEENTL